MPKAIIIFETRKGSTEQIAETIAESLKQSGVEVVLERIRDVEITELTAYQGIILGSPTYHKDMVESMKTLLFKLEKVDLKGKIGASFGAYGWSGEAVEMISDTMSHIFGMEMVLPEKKLAGSVSGVGRAEFEKFGKKIAETIKAKGS